ncbi:MAG TPA: OmpA family protein [Polyangiaceae bacterium]|nr:OmpA family protein [Polyangiaceae bacterium]
MADARTAYQRASSGPAARENPAQVHVAEQALSVAEKTFDDEGDSDKARDRAYVAIRKAELAEVQADIAQLAKQTAEAQQRSQLANARTQEQMRNQLGNATAQLAAQRQELDTERQARAEAEKRAADTRAALERIAAVRSDNRGVIVTLPGGVLFASGKSELLGTAKTKLSEVATVLSKDPNAKLTVEGYTDSRGSDQLNNELSEKRAEAVRSFLVSRGIAAANIVAEGHGKDKPIADNATAEGRANNRRVEIVVQSGQAGQRAADGVPAATPNGSNPTNGSNTPPTTAPKP